MYEIFEKLLTEKKLNLLTYQEQLVYQLQHFRIGKKGKVPQKLISFKKLPTTSIFLLNI